MLNQADPMATLAVSDLEKAAHFYEQILGFELIGQMHEEVHTYQSGNAQFIVYRSEFAGTNQATSICWSLGKQFDEVVATLKKQGITFLHYEMPGITREGDVHIGGDMKVAWFTDPDGMF